MDQEFAAFAQAATALRHGRPISVSLGLAAAKYLDRQMRQLDDARMMLKIIDAQQVVSPDEVAHLRDELAAEELVLTDIAAHAAGVMQDVWGEWRSFWPEEERAPIWQTMSRWHQTQDGRAS